MRTKKLLIVDDDALTGESLTTLLRGRGFQAEWAANGESALTRLGAQKYDALVLDEYMPVMTGVELLRKLRAFPLWRGVPVLVLTAAPDGDAERVRAELDALAPASLLRKPADLDTILAVLHTMLGGQPP